MPSFSVLLAARPLLAVFFCLAGLTTARAQFDTAEKSYVTPSLIADTAAVAAGKQFTVAVRLKMDPGWHVYWQFGGDAGAPPSIEWELPPGFHAGAIQWPLPTAHRDEGDLLSYIHEGELMLLVEITPPASLPPGEVVLRAKLKWLVCEKICIPGGGDVQLALPVGTASPANADRFIAARAQLPKAEGAPFTAKWDRSSADRFSLRLEGLTKGAKIEFFPLPPPGVKPGQPVPSGSVADGAHTLTFPIATGGAANLPWRGVVAIQRGDAPRAGWLVDSARGESFSATAATGALAPAQQNLLALIWSAFLGGLILNLMPCVLPVIALKIFGFVQQAGQEPRRIFRLGLAFVAGVFAFFLGLAALIVGLKMAGIDLTWGFQFQNLGILIGLIALVFVFAMNLLGVFEIALTAGTAGTLSELSGREGYGGAFLHGMFTTLLGTSCTAPLLGAVLGFAFAAPPHIVVILFTAIAAGMSLPYFLLTANPAWMRFLPKPGTWMERLKQLMGFIMLGVVVWLLGPVGKRGVDLLVATCGFLLVLALACWIYGAWGSRWKSWLAIALVVAAGYFGFFGAAKKDGIAWEPWSEARVAAAVAAKQPVFVDFTADWCANCKYNEKVVIETAPVRAALKRHNILPLKGDFTAFDPAIAATLRKFQRAGVPVYLFYRAGESEPVVLPEILTQNGLLEALGKAGS